MLIATLCVTILLFVILLLGNRKEKVIETAWEEWTETGRYYSYCPSYIQTSDTERYIYYCRNEFEGQIKDSIYMRPSIKKEESWEWGEAAVALVPSENGWDSIHVCDPDVKEGSFLYNNHTYRYIMFYLGSDKSNSNHNQIGVAFADSMNGPWTKWEANPIIEFGFANYWGKGQPSAISLDGKGKLMLFYSCGDLEGTRMAYREMDLSDMSNPWIGEERVVPTDGLTESDGSQVILHNGGLAYDEGTDRYYLVRPRHPFDIEAPNFISSQLQVAYTPASTFHSGTGTWTVEGHVTPEQSEKERNHNSCLLTDTKGGLIGGADGYQINFTGSDIGGFPDNLWSYRLYGIGKEGLIP